jgi:hypothetical protein
LHPRTLRLVQASFAAVALGLLVAGLLPPAVYKEDLRQEYLTALAWREGSDIFAPIDTLGRRSIPLESWMSGVQQPSSLRRLVASPANRAQAGAYISRKDERGKMKDEIENRIGPLRFTPYPSSLILSFAIGLGLRLALAVFGPTNFDLTSYGIVAGIVRAGGNVYAETARYNYAPVWMYVVTGLSYLPVPLYVGVRVFISCVDVANGYILLRMYGPRAGVLYWLNPFSILLMSWGQFETLAALPLLVAMARAEDRSWRPWALATLSMVIKHIVLFQVFAFLVCRYGRRKGVIAFFLASAVFALSFVPFLRAFSGIHEHVVKYASITIPYGSGLISYRFGVFILVQGLLIFPLVAQKAGVDERETVGLSTLLLFVLAPFSLFYYWILVPLLALPQALRFPSWAVAFAGVGTVLGLYVNLSPYLAEHLATFLDPTTTAWLPLNAMWVVYAGWLASAIRFMIASRLRPAPAN